MSDNREFASIFQLVLNDERINPDELRDYSETDTVTKVEGGEISLSKEFVRDIRKLWVKTDEEKFIFVLRIRQNWMLRIKSE